MIDSLLGMARFNGTLTRSLDRSSHVQLRWFHPSIRLSVRLMVRTMMHGIRVVVPKSQSWCVCLSVCRSVCALGFISLHALVGFTWLDMTRRVCAGTDSGAGWLAGCVAFSWLCHYSLLSDVASWEMSCVSLSVWLSPWRGGWGWIYFEIVWEWMQWWLLNDWPTDM